MNGGTKMTMFKYLYYLTLIAIIDIAESAKKITQIVPCNYTDQSMKEYEENVNIWHIRDHEYSYRDSKDVIQRLMEYDENIPRARYLENDRYLRGLIESFITNDFSVKTFYDQTMNGLTDFARRKQLRCVVENFIEEVKLPTEQSNVAALAKDFGDLYNYVNTIHTEAHFYDYAKEVAREVVREFVKMYLVCDPLNALQCIGDHTQRQIMGYYVDKMQLLIDTIDGNEHRDTSNPAADSNKVLAIKTHLKMYVYWLEYPGCDGTDSCYGPTYLQNVDTFSQKMVSGTDDDITMIYNIVRDWNVQIQGIIKQQGRPSQIDLSWDPEKYAKLIYLRFLEGMKTFTSMTALLNDLKNNFMEQQLFDCISLRVNEENDNQQWIESMEKVPWILNPNPKMDYADNWLLTVHWNALVHKYRDDVYLQRLEQLKRRGIECDEPMTQECSTWLTNLRDLRKEIDDYMSMNIHSWTTQAQIDDITQQQHTKALSLVFLLHFAFSLL